jgi:hypothetical protein
MTELLLVKLIDSVKNLCLQPGNIYYADDVCLSIRIFTGKYRTEPKHNQANHLVKPIKFV